MPKKITIQLSEESIKAAIKELDKYKKELSKKATILVQKLVDAGVEIAKQEVLTLGAFDSGELASSLDGLMYTDGAHGIIFTNCGHAAFVEFGIPTIEQMTTLEMTAARLINSESGIHYLDVLEWYANSIAGKPVSFGLNDDKSFAKRVYQLTLINSQANKNKKHNGCNFE